MNAGLCDRCIHQRIIRNDRDSAFVICKLSETDPDFPRYPPLPVLRCSGFLERAETPAESTPAPDEPR